MKGLVEIPTQGALQGAYEALQIKKEPLAPESIVLWSQWARFDPRLAEILVTHLGRNWRTLMPVFLNELLQRVPWPSAFGVLLYQAQEFGNLTKGEKLLFKKWIDCAMANIAPAPSQQFFIGLRALGGKLMREDAELSTRPYNQWGYLGREVLFNKMAQNTAPRGDTREKTMIPRRARLAALDALLENRTRVTVREYREKLHNAVSVRQAELDFESNLRLKPQGQTKGRTYAVRSKRRAK